MKPIRLATLQDVDNITQIVNWAYRGGKEKKTTFQEEHLISGDRIETSAVTELLSDPLFGTPGGPSVLILEADSTQMIGCIKVDAKEGSEEVELGMFAVDPDFAGQGHGRTLLNYAFDYARSLHKKVAFIWVLHVRSDILGWYSRQGFVPNGETADFPTTGGVGKPRPGYEEIMFICLKKTL